MTGGFEDQAGMGATGAGAVPRRGPGAAESTERLDVILDIELPLVIRFGHTEVPLKTLVQLGPGSVIDLGRSPHEPVELLVSNRVVARGEVVVVSGNYGIRVIDVIRPLTRGSVLEAGR